MAQYDQVVAQRVVDQLIALHKDDDVIQGATPEAKLTWLSEHPYLAGMAKESGLSLDDLLLASMSQSYEWGASFEKLYHRPPTMDDWKNGYWEISNALCEKLGMMPAFVGNNETGWRLKLEYGGPF